MRDAMEPGAQPSAIVPRTFAEVMTMCQALAAANLAPKNLRGNATDMALVVMTGAEVGLPPMASLRLYTTWDGVPRLMAEGVRAIILQSPAVEYFEMSTCSDTEATWIGKRRGRPEKSVTWTIERAKKAQLLGKENWTKYPQDMLNARASMQLGRIIAPDVVAGMVSREEAMDGDFIEAQFTDVKAPVFVAPPAPQGPPPGVPSMTPQGRIIDLRPPEVAAVTVAGTGTPEKRGPGRPPNASKAAEVRPTSPAIASTPSPKPSASTSPPATGSTSAAAPEASSPPARETVNEDGDIVSVEVAVGPTPPADASPVPAGSVAAAADEGFGDDPPDAAPPADDVAAKMAEFRAWVAGCKTKRELSDGMRPWHNFVKQMASEPNYDVRFNKGGELAEEMSGIFSKRKAEVPA